MSRRWLTLGMASLGGTGTLLAVVAAACLGSGCSTAGYYVQSVGGHLGIMEAARPVGPMIDDPATDPALRRRLVLSQRIRDFAVAELKEPDNASYRRYADLHRTAALWNVVAAPVLSLRPQTWCFLVVGCVAYRGYYDRGAADAFAAELRAQGLEVAVYGVPAYSTLGKLPDIGFFADPLLNTFIDYPEGDLARLMFHELAHQVAFAPGDTVFNESFATAVERLGSARWLAAHATPQAREAFALSEARRADFQALTGRTREQLQALYDSPASDADKLRRKAELMADMRAEYARLKRERWQGYAGYDAWFERANNATFGVLAAYTGLVPDFERLFDREGRDWTAFYAEVRRIAALPPAERLPALH